MWSPSRPLVASTSSDKDSADLEGEQFPGRLEHPPHLRSFIRNNLALQRPRSPPTRRINEYASSLKVRFPRTCLAFQEYQSSVLENSGLVLIEHCPSSATNIQPGPLAPSRLITDEHGDIWAPQLLPAALWQKLSFRTNSENADPVLRNHVVRVNPDAAAPTTTPNHPLRWMNVEEALREAGLRIDPGDAVPYWNLHRQQPVKFTHAIVENRGRFIARFPDFHMFTEGAILRSEPAEKSELLLGDRPGWDLRECMDVLRSNQFDDAWIADVRTSHVSFSILARSAVAPKTIGDVVIRVLPAAEGGEERTYLVRSDDSVLIPASAARRRYHLPTEANVFGCLYGQPGLSSEDLTLYTTEQLLHNYGPRLETTRARKARLRELGFQKLPRRIDEMDCVALELWCRTELDRREFLSDGFLPLAQAWRQANLPALHSRNGRTLLGELRSRGLIEERLLKQELWCRPIDIHPLLHDGALRKLVFSSKRSYQVAVTLATDSEASDRLRLEQFQ